MISDYLFMKYYKLYDFILISTQTPEHMILNDI